MTFQIQVAEKRFEIHSLYEEVYEMCKEYISSASLVDHCIDICEEDILHEYRHDRKNALSVPSPKLLAHYETLVVYRKIADCLLDESVLLMHGAVIATNNEAYMITAPSGVGKTARIDMWLRRIPESYVVNGDKPLISVDGSAVIAYGTPWCGKEKRNTNIGVPLKAIMLLERSQNTEISELTFKEALPVLISQTYKTNQAEQLFQTLALLKQMDGKVKFYRYMSAFSEESVLRAYETVNNL